MNGIHDLGGMHGLGPVVREDREPVFHHDWERQVFRMALAAAAQLPNLDEFRHAIERMPPALYLTSTYYEHWLYAIETLLSEKGIISREEIEDRIAGGLKAGVTKSSATPAVAFERRAADAPRGEPASGSAGKPRFSAGDQVVARNVNPTGHTRLPRYVRGKRGVVERDHGAYVFPDANAHGLGRELQHVYGVRFEARELWGDEAPKRDTVRVDLWESYLAPAAMEGAR